MNDKYYDMGFFWDQGEEHITGDFFNFTNDACPFGNAPSQVPRFLWTDNTGTTETSIFIKANHIEAGNGSLLSSYDDSPNTKARIWWNVGFYNAVDGAGAFDLLGDALVYFYDCGKIAAKGDVFKPSNAGTLWVDCEKVTENGSGHWVNDIGAQTNYFRVEHWEDNSGVMTSGFLLQKSVASASYFYGGSASLTGGPVVKYGLGNGSPGPVTSFEGMTMQTTGTNADIWMNGYTNGLTLLACNLHSQSAQGSIYAIVPSFVQGIFNADQYPTNFVHMTGTNFVHASANVN